MERPKLSSFFSHGNLNIKQPQGSSYNTFASWKNKSWLFLKRVLKKDQIIVSLTGRNKKISEAQ